MLNDKYPFARHVRELYKELSKLEQLELPSSVEWTIDWEHIQQISPEKPPRFRASEHAFFAEIKRKKEVPAIYYFSLAAKEREMIFKTFRKIKDAASELRIHSGVRHADFRNVCHVPAVSSDSECLYVGSVKKNVGTRLQQHLGLTNSGRTGAMYLLQLLPHLTFTPKITITIYFFGKSYTHLTEHIEYVFQKELNPILGKRSIIDVTL